MSENVVPLRESSSRSAEEVRQERKVAVALGYRIFGALRWGDMGDGHISARDPEREDCFWMLRYGVSYHKARVSDLVMVDPDGQVAEGKGPINRAAYFIHHPILMARPEAVSAAHVHTPWGTPFSAEVRPIEPISQESCVFFEDHAIFDDEEVQIQDTDGGKRIAAAMGSHRAVILRNHGLLTATDGVAETVGLFVELERVAEVHMKARHAKPISAEAARYAKEDLTSFGPGRVVFASLVARHIDDPACVLE